jgi:aldose 1-epimerase
MAIPSHAGVLQPKRFAGQVNGQQTSLFLLHNAVGSVVAITNLGAKVLQILVPDRHGEHGDVVLGYDSLSDVMNGSPSLGAFIGRYAGRIANASFKHHGQVITLQANDGVHCLHGGSNGSRHQVFKAQQHDAQTLVLQHWFHSHVDGFTGSLNLTLTYHLSDDNALTLQHHARIDSGDTPASFASHIFFNLNGQGNINEHQLQVYADHILQTDDYKVCNGDQQALDGHELDLRNLSTLGHLPDLDHAYIVQPHHAAPSPAGAIPQCVAKLYSPYSGRFLETWSTEPVLQVYGSGALGNGPIADIGKNGVHHQARSAVCLEPQRYPNAPNCPSFPLNYVTPDKPYQATTSYCFGVKS